MILISYTQQHILLPDVVIVNFGINQTVNRTIINIHLKRRKLDLSFASDRNRNRLSLNYAINCRNRERWLLGCQIVQARNIQR